MQTFSQESPQEAGTDSVVADTAQAMFARREITFSLVGLGLVLLLASLDGDVVATAMPRIVGEFQGFDQYTWVTTAYMLTTTMVIPIYGKLSDLFKRKTIFLISVLLFLAGSGLSGMAQSMNQLIIFRAFQGLGAGGIMPVAMSIIGTLFTPRARIKVMSAFGPMLALSSLVGPLLGGWITEHVSWRWIFYVNLPIGGLALLALIFLMPSFSPPEGSKPRIDYAGAALIIAGVVPILLGLNLAGSVYAWLSWQILCLIGGGLLIMVLLFVYQARLERSGGEPIIMPRFFRNKVFSISLVITVITFAGLFGCVAFLPLFLQGVLGVSPTASGLTLTPMMLAVTVSSSLSGLLISKWGRYKGIAVVGMALAVLGSALLLRLDVHSGYLDVIIPIVVLGLGLGISVTIYGMLVQVAFPQHIGQASASFDFFQEMAGPIALAALGSVLILGYGSAFYSALSPEVRQNVPPRYLGLFEKPNNLLDPNSAHALSSMFATLGQNGQKLLGQVMEATRVGLAGSIHSVFIVGTVILLLGLLVSLFLPVISLDAIARDEDE
jgi:EmrB/QacA subfamily drug resistance transporter